MAAIVEELGDLIYRDPATARWEMADEYLSGDVRAKLKAAEAAGAGCARNAEALRAVHQGNEEAYRQAIAAGTIKAARTRLAMVDVGGLVVRDVDAMVLPDEALSENLLGLSFLSKLKRFEYANGQMVLEQ